MYAVLALHRNEDIQVDAYGLILYRDSETEYARAAVHLQPPLPVNKAIREALAHVVALTRGNVTDLPVFGAEQAFCYERSGRKFERAVASVQLHLLPTKYIGRERTVALEAARSKVTKIEINGGNL